MVDWLAEDVDTLLLLLVIMALLIMFYRFQERLIEKERRTQVELSMLRHYWRSRTLPWRKS